MNKYLLFKKSPLEARKKKQNIIISTKYKVKEKEMNNTDRNEDMSPLPTLICQL